MFGKKKTEAKFPAAEFGDRLDALITAGRNAGISMTKIAGELEQRVKNLRVSAAVNANLNPVPRVYDAWGRPI